MGTIIGDTGQLFNWIRKETDLKRTLKKGSKGKAVKRVQEWLSLHRMSLVMDGDFGKVTKRIVERFQEEHGLPVSGTVNRITFEELTSPLNRVLQPITPKKLDFASLVSLYARTHLTENPREVGGQNRGPWVRLYMKGNEGEAWPWCAGFVTFVMKQAAETLQMSMPIKGSFSCDSLAAQGANADCFVREAEISRGVTSIDDISAASIFLVRRTSTDWTHTGLVTRFNTDSFETIEGNTNDEGSREGFEVCARTRGYSKKDFIAL